MPGIEISQTTFSFDHTVIVTDCPQPVGSFVLTNTGNETLQVTITGANADASNIDLGATSLTLEPGASQEVSVGFNCGRGTSFTAEFLVEGVGATSGETTSTGLQVVGNVMM